MRPIQQEDAQAWLRMRRELWPDGAEDHAPEIVAFFDGSSLEPSAVFVAEYRGNCAALMELSIRRDLPGHSGEKVGYVEGLYVVPEFRRAGLVRQLLRAAQRWAHQEECSAFASDRSGRIVFDPKYKP
jgi:aminoglycoside 6'-N-acetyltransferase I